MVDPGQRMPVPLVPFAHETLSNSRTCVPAAAPLLCTPIVRFAMLRRNWFRPWLPTYATVAAKFPGSSRCTDAVY